MSVSAVEHHTRPKQPLTTASPTPTHSSIQRRGTTAQQAEVDRKRTHVMHANQMPHTRHPYASCCQHRIWPLLEPDATTARFPHTARCLTWHPRIRLRLATRTAAPLPSASTRPTHSHREGCAGASGTFHVPCTLSCTSRPQRLPTSGCGCLPSHNRVATRHRRSASTAQSLAACARTQLLPTRPACCCPTPVP